MKRLLIDCKPDFIFTALTENARAVELFIDPASDAGGSWVGRIVVGRLKTILPGLFAFVDIGAKKNAFINLRKGHGLKAGQPLLVQVEKDASGTKGMCVTLEISIKGRLVVLYSGTGGAKHTQAVGISRKLDEKEARRLRKIARKALPAGYGAIIRTNAAHATAEEITAEIAALHAAHADICARAEFALPPAVLHPPAQESAVSKNLLTDILSDELEEIHIQTDSDALFAEISEKIREVLPTLAEKISRRPISLEKQIRAALAKEIRLPCGGTVTIEQTEACVVIDVNTAANVGTTDYRATVLETNLEAAAAIAAALRLRNLSGIIIADFIDMPTEADRTELLAALAAATKKDRIKTEIIGFIGLGMVQMTRRKIRPPIAAVLQKKCEVCGGMLL